MVVETGDSVSQDESHSHPQSQSHSQPHPDPFPGADLAASVARNCVYDMKARYERCARYWVRSVGVATGGAACPDWATGGLDTFLSTASPTAFVTLLITGNESPLNPISAFGRVDGWDGGGAA
jgi:hypothetical protein